MRRGFAVVFCGLVLMGLFAIGLKLEERWYPLGIIFIVGAALLESRWGPKVERLAQRLFRLSE